MTPASFTSFSPSHDSSCFPAAKDYYDRSAKPYHDSSGKRHWTLPCRLSQSGQNVWSVWNVFMPNFLLVSPEYWLRYDDMVLSMVE